MAALQLHRATLELPRPKIDAPARVARLVKEQLAKKPLAPGSSVALAVGSRKINSLPAIVAQIVAILKGYDCHPFIVPAMGTHAGGTARGQLELLASLGITEKTVGAPLRAGAEPILAGNLTRHSAGQTAGYSAGQPAEKMDGLQIWCDPLAWQADAIIPINRVKPHTAFRASVESGPSKMIAVGLGGQKSAQRLHRAGLAASIPAVVEFFLAHGKLAFGVAVVENGWGETAAAELIDPARWLEGEAVLLVRAWELYPRLLWEELDLLIVEKMGKDISGTGMDINVIGMQRRFPDFKGGPRIGKVVALELTGASGGNANGVGYADYVTARLADGVDWELTMLNSRVAGFPLAGRCPTVEPDEASAIAAALGALPPARRANSTCRAVRIKNTSNLVDLQLSQALLKELPPQVRALARPCP
jgi:hypothetical protein